ncbi:conjugal transfer protein TraW [Novosphingobium sp. H3SJ31-1]|uniref:Conjugal transfer protein TraW n=1 Tax=Novosphingobium album (ex Liu et al. 2023) TaxID=3031130 RepID=A0ABT5WX32_9SPHN|nr:conjugal transfer protein TraW [Novosphingobium album (ex Liu et al. 2023)]MDE8654463.1 conjugal transfer protein TraW [Novosphingobium album (ex Liu et al. 2023)]
MALLAALPAAAQAGPSTAGHASTIGRTWPIAEPDALAEIEARVAGQPTSISGKFGPRQNWTAMRSATLTRAAVTRTRYVVPFYTLDQDISLPGGRLLYAKGYTFNPLSYVTLPQRLIVVQPRDLDWALRQARSADFILLAAGGPRDADAITLGERHARALFILEDRVKDRLGLTAAPVIVHQVGQRLQLDEVRLDSGRPRS